MKCFKCGKDYNENDIEQVDVLDYDVSSHEELVSQDNETCDLKLNLCDKCFDLWLIENGFDYCDECNMLSNELETVCTDKGCKNMSNGDPGWPPEYEELCPTCRSDDE